MYKLKTIARRSSLLGITAAFTAAAIFPAALVSANALTPLTERSLLLTSSAPGYVDTDGSGYSTANPNPAGDGVLGGVGVDTPYTFAPANSGPNGKKTGETFTFRASSTETIRALTFQYCTTAAGMCQAPGNNTGDARGTWDEQEEEWTGPSTREANSAAWLNSRSDLDVTGVFVQKTASLTLPDVGDYEDEEDPLYIAAMEAYENSLITGGGQFKISVNGVETSTDDWAFTATNWEDDTNNPHTGKNNLVTLRSTTGTAISAGDFVEVKFVASENIYITNPGAGHFFVKINTYNLGGANEQLPTTNANIVDGGVTVANVMADSIHITTKVLETMSFSVGIQNPDTLEEAQASDHGTCDIILQNSTITGLTNNRLNLGNPSAEYSLETSKAWDVYSYWRLSSNSSGGATVYYSGNTLANTVGDEIRAMDAESATLSRPGTEQFGLGFVDVTNGAHADTLSTTFQSAVSNNALPHTNPTSYPFITVTGQESGAPFDALAAQPTSNEYKQATGTIDDGDAGAGTARFKFVPTSIFVPEPIAQQDETVISCATAKMRYVGNIAPDTPAGVYTTKVNYLAAPQY